MTTDKAGLLEILDEEIEDRSTQADESGEAESYAEEISELKLLRTKVEQEQDLSFSEYAWLADLVATAALLDTEE